MTDKEQQIEALKGSIKKWEDIYNGVATDDGIHNCPCCILYNAEGCYGCPVAEAVKWPYCDETPYNAWYDYVKRKHRTDVVFDEQSKALALAELNFLKSILEKLQDE